MPCMLDEGETRMPGRKAQIEAVYSHMWASHEGGPFAPLDESLHPRPHSMLYEVVSACGVSASSLVLDVGSGRGNHSCALAQRFGCTVVGLDVAQFHVEQGRARAVQEGVSDRVSFVQGTIEALPCVCQRAAWQRVDGMGGRARRAGHARVDALGSDAAKERVLSRVSWHYEI